MFSIKRYLEAKVQRHPIDGIVGSPFQTVRLVPRNGVLRDANGGFNVEGGYDWYETAWDTFGNCYFRHVLWVGSGDASLTGIAWVDVHLTNEYD